MRIYTRKIHFVNFYAEDKVILYLTGTYLRIAIFIIFLIFLFTPTKVSAGGAYFPVTPMHMIGTFNCTIEKPDNPAYIQGKTIEFDSYVNTSDSTSPYIYAWISNIDGDIVFREKDERSDLSVDKHQIELRVSDFNTDRQRPTFPLIEEETKTIVSNVSINISDGSTCNSRIVAGGLFSYNPYRCGDTSMPCFYRLFEQNKTWVKIFTINPLVEDTNVILDPKSLGVSRNSLVAEWHFDEGSGNIAYDTSGYGNDADFSGVSSPAWVSGKSGSALEFDGINDYVTTPTLTPIHGVPINDFTFVAWVKYNSDTGTIQQIFESHVGVLGNEIRLEGDFPFLEFTITDDSGVVHTISTSLSSLNTWYLIVATYNGTHQKLYVNGAEVASATWSNNFTLILPIILGRDYEIAAQHFHGVMDEVQVFARALTPDEILNLYNSTYRCQTYIPYTTSYGNPLAGWQYRVPITIQENSGNKLTDYQVLIYVDTQSLISAGKMRPDCGDIRFTDSDGVTLLPYWIEEGCNTANTKIWVKVPEIPSAGTKTIYMYYGNPGALSTSDPDSVFDLYDEFNSLDTSKWDVSRDNGDTSLECVVEGGYMKLVKKSQWRGCNIKAKNFNVKYDDKYIIQFKFFINYVCGITNDGDGMALVIDGSNNGADPACDKGFSTTSQGMVVEIFDDAASTSSDNGIGIDDDTGDCSKAGFVTHWGTGWKKGDDLNSGIITVKLTGSNIIVEYEDLNSNNGLKSASISNPIWDPGGSGYFMIGAGTGWSGCPGSSDDSGHWIDWIKVRKYTDPEPSFLLGAEEEVLGAGTPGIDVPGTFWTRTSTPEPDRPSYNETPVRIYIGAGCELVDARDFSVSSGGYKAEAAYPLPVWYQLNVTVDDGVNPPETVTIEGWNVSIYPQGWNLLPYPPAETIHGVNENETHQLVMHHHELQGARYSFFVVNYSLPDNATQMLITADYTCRAILERNVTIGTTQCPETDVIVDYSTVSDCFFVGYVENSTLGHLNITVEGYYDTISSGGTEWVDGGLIRINITPDILASIVLSVDDEEIPRERIPRVEYKHLDYPVKHVLFKKENTPGEDMLMFTMRDQYGRESNLPSECSYQLCPANCDCFGTGDVIDVFNPQCYDFSTDPPTVYYPNIDPRYANCRCVQIEECYPEPCYASGLERTFHEHEGKRWTEPGGAGFAGYYDFVHHYVIPLYPITNYITPVIDMDGGKIIGIDNITMNPEFMGDNNEYIIDFDVAGVDETTFLNEGKLTLFTHLRERDYNFRDYLIRRKKSWINYQITSSSGYFLHRTYNPSTREWDEIGRAGTLHVGDWVTVRLHVVNEHAENIKDGKVKVSVSNHEDIVAGVVWENGEKYVTTDSGGIATFSFHIRDDAAVKANFLGDWNNTPSEVYFPLEPVVESPILSLEFFFLLIIALFIIFSYRWFRRKRLDLYAIWQELKGEVEE